MYLSFSIGFIDDFIYSIDFIYDSFFLSVIYTVKLWTTPVAAIFSSSSEVHHITLISQKAGVNFLWTNPSLIFLIHKTMIIASDSLGLWD